MNNNLSTESSCAPAALKSLWKAAGQPESLLDLANLSGEEPCLPSSFAIGSVAQASIAATGLAAARRQMRGGRPQRVAVNMRHACAEFRSERYVRVAGEAAPELWDTIAGIYRCGDGGWVRLHTNFPHHRDGVLRLLQCAYDKASVAQALLGWSAENFEQAAADAGLVVAAFRTAAQWDAHPQGIAVASQDLLTIEKIDDAPVTPLSPPDRSLATPRPLSGVRVLDLTRIIAGPVCGRTLAAHGADVMLATGPHLPAITPLVIDTGRGKLSCQIDLRNATGQEQLGSLIDSTDIFVQGYRPGGIARYGFDAARLARQRPGIICVSLSAYGHTGPWTKRRGFDSLVQTASGFNDEEQRAFHSESPRPLPAQALDHAAGYLMALGAMTALARRATEGGSWHVRVSLARTGQWIRSLGRVPAGISAPDLDPAELAGWMEESNSGFGRLLAVRHAAELSETPAHWERPSVPLGTHPPAWPD